MQQEVISIRVEVDDIWRRVNLIKEAQALHEELNQIKNGIIEVQNQAKQTIANSDLAREKQEKERQERERKEKEEQERKERERKEREEREKKEREEREREERERKQAEERAKQEKAVLSQKIQPVQSAPVKVTNVPPTKQAPSSKPIGQSYLNVGKPVPLNSTDKYMEEKKLQESLERDAVFGAQTRVVQKPEFQQFGIDQDIKQRLSDKYNPNMEKEAREWIESVTGAPLQGSFAESLKSGVVLCNLINNIKPKTIKKINTFNRPFMQMENIKFFLESAKMLGVPEPDLFMTVDLFEEKNMTQVVQGIHSLGRACQKVEGYNGPTIGAKLASKHETHFTEEQMRKGHTELNYSQQNQVDTQKVVSEMRKPGLDSVIKTRNVGITTSDVGLLDKGKLDAQKEANSAKRVGHNIIK